MPTVSCLLLAVSETKSGLVVAAACWDVDLNPGPAKYPSTMCFSAAGTLQLAAGDFSPVQSNQWGIEV